MTRISIGGASPAGLRWPNYVNGRILSAQDLSAGREAVLLRDRWLGLAIGSGVASGLEVTGSPGSSRLSVAPGTGVAPGGTALHLETTATIDLAVVSTSAPTEGGVFAQCAPTSSTTAAPSAGAYLLVMSPASRFTGGVPVAGSPTSTLSPPCASRWEVEDVAFTAVRLDGFTTATTAANRRTLLAQYCFGSNGLRALALAGFRGAYPGLAGLAELTSCDLPLAAFDWDGSTLVFVDLWSARRRPVHPSASAALDAVVGDRRAAEGEARFLQFQDQLDGLLTTAAGSATRALDVFPALPPAGIVPIVPVAAAAWLRARQPQPSPTPSPLPGPQTPGPIFVPPIIDSVIDRPDFERPDFERPDFEVPVVDRPVVDRPVVGRPVVDTPLTGLPVTGRPVSGRPVVDAASPLRRFLAEEAALAGPATAASATTTAAAAAAATGSPTRLGALSSEMLHLHDQIDDIRAVLDGISRGPTGGSRPVGRPTPNQAASASLVDTLIALLLDTPGTGVDPAVFFAGLTVRVGVIDLDAVDSTLRRSWFDAPVTLATQPSIAVYFVISPDDQTLAPYVLFGSRQRDTRWIDA
jgi:hypothetical protein